MDWPLLLRNGKKIEDEDENEDEKEAKIREKVNNSQKAERRPRQG